MKPAKPNNHCADYPLTANGLRRFMTLSIISVYGPIRKPPIYTTSLRQSIVKSRRLLLITCELWQLKKGA